jgi:hypothetical protein
MSKVYKAISAVMADLAVDGIGKDRKNEQQNYKFRGIDDVYNALSSTLAKNGLLMLPRVLSREVAERVSAKGSVLFYVTVEAEFDLVASEDGSTHTIKTYGEAMDSGDKATNKAMSAAFKYAAMQAFCIPTEGDNDTDATTHVVTPKNPPEPVKPLTLSERADRFETVLRQTTPDDLSKVWAKASGLCAELDAALPERLAELTTLYEWLIDLASQTPFTKEEAK